MFIEPRRVAAGFSFAVSLFLATAAAAQQPPAPGMPTPPLAADTPLVPPAAPVTLSMGDVVRAAATTTPAAAIAALRTEEARGRLLQARSVFFPTVNGAASFMRRTQNLKSFGFSLPSAPGAPALPTRIGPINIWDYRGQVTQALFDPSGWIRSSAARAQVTAAAAEAGTAGETAASQAAGAYVAALHARATVREREEDLALARDLVRDAEAQFRAGVGTRLDIVRANTQEAQARAGVEMARSQVTQAEVDLARALGIVPGTRFTFGDSLTAETGRSLAVEAAGSALTPEFAAAAGAGGQTPAGLDALMRLALARRPELAAARAGVQAARLAGRAVRAQRLGRLELAGDYGLNGPKPTDMITTGQLALQYAIPFFEGFRLEGQLHEQEAQRREAEVRLADLTQQVAGDVRQAAAAVTSGVAQQRIAQEQVDFAREELREARLRYRNGLSGNIDVITAQADLVRARTALLDAEAQAAAARVRLARAAGVSASLR